MNDADRLAGLVEQLARIKTERDHLHTRVAELAEVRDRLRNKVQEQQAQLYPLELETSLSRIAAEVAAASGNQPRQLYYVASMEHIHDYMRTLYANGPKHGFRVRGVRWLDDVPADITNAVVHVHWTDAQAFHQQRLADEAVDRWVAKLDDLRSANNTIVWSIHEPLPHSIRHREAEIRFRSALADRANIIHVLNDTTVAACAELFAIDPAKVVHIPMQSLASLHASVGGRSTLRHSLGISPDTAILLSFGVIKPYKHIVEVAKAAQAIGALALIVGPAFVKRYDIADSLEAARELGAIVVDTYVEDQAVGPLFEICDAVALPYDAEAHNSAVLNLALSLRRPVVLPSGGVASYFSFDLDQLSYDQAEFPQSFVTAAQRACSGADAAAWQDIFDRFAEEHEAGAISDRYFGALASLSSQGGQA